MPVAEPTTTDDPELTRIVDEEEQCLARVLAHVEERRGRKSERPPADYDEQMLALRDEMVSARLEDLPPLLEQMERLQSLAAHRRETSEGVVDVRSPYFGRLVLQEGERRREVLIGRSTYLDTRSGVRIVDWRDAPVSRLYYRYDEGDEYDEVFGEREVSGEVITRRSLSIVDGELRRIGSPQGAFSKLAGGWRRLDEGTLRLAGGQGSALRPEQHRAPGSLGVGADGSEDKHLREITALIDPRQFELITHSDAGLVVIQGGAGSGKTTIGLHRLAYLAYHDPRRFRADRMLVVVFNTALARYISQVLPALGVSGLAIRTYEDWAERTRVAQLPRVPRRYSDATPNVVTRLKKHPAMLKVIDDRVHQLGDQFERELDSLGSSAEGARAAWRTTASRPLSHRLHALRSFVARGGNVPLDSNARLKLEGLIERHLRVARDVVGAWADLVSDREFLGASLARHAPGVFTTSELDRACAWSAQQASELISELEDRAEARASARDDDELEDDGDDRRHGIDGARVDEQATLDREDDALLLRLCQRLRGPLLRGAKNKEALVYEHILVDEAQDLSPVELAVVLDTASAKKSVTLSGDVAQRLHMDNGFSDWQTVLAELDLTHVAVDPLQLSYRSTHEILELSRAVLGPLAPAEPPKATRHGAPVELFTFGHAGDAVAFLADALRELSQREPRASVALITRYPEQADLYYDGLSKGEIPYLRRIADQDFPFRPGIDVTDVRQVKGLEFDYVILVETSRASYPEQDEARHLLHIAATRAAHQLWVLATGEPSRLLPAALREPAL